MEALALDAVPLPPLLAHNTLPIGLQCPHATHVAGFRKWLELGRCVRKGEKAIRIFAPVRYRRRAEDEERLGDEDEPQVTGFRLACVFDVSQTEPLPGVDPAPLDPPRAPIEGDTHQHLLAPLAEHAAALGFKVYYEPLGERDGYCSTRDSRIGIDSTLSANPKVATLVHELAHAHGVDYDTYSRAKAELIVESVAYVVCGSAGLDTSTDSIPYLAAWNATTPYSGSRSSPTGSTRSRARSSRRSSARSATKQAPRPAS